VIRSLLFAIIITFAPPVWAAPIDRAIFLVQVGRCDVAVPLLVQLEAQEHRPRAADALAGCLEKQGKLVEAHATYRALAAEKRSFRWDFFDVVAWQRAPKRAASLEPRIPSLTIDLAESYADAALEIDGKPATPATPVSVDPRTKIRVEVRAKGYEAFRAELELAEGEKRRLGVKLELVPVAPPPPEKPPERAVEPPPSEKEPPDRWLGARFRGTLIPQFVMNAFGEGGTTVFSPGAGITVSLGTPGPDVVVSVAYASFGMGATAYKPKDRPDTEYEIIESDLMSLSATVDLLAPIPLSADGAWLLRIGGGLGIGWMFVGELYRTQAYEDDGEYVKCDGPNDPPGTFRYCNQLDKDADHYDNHPEPDWFHGGVRPLIYPWVAFPQFELSWQFAERGRLDIELGVTIAGFLMGIGARYGL
jgi:hypothetical protein